MPLLWCLYLYLRGDRQLVPQSPFGKGVAVTLMLLWVTVAGYAYHGAGALFHAAGALLLWIPAAVASMLLLSFATDAQHAVVPVDASATPSDAKWRVGARYLLLWGFAPVLLLWITG